LGAAPLGIEKIPDPPSGSVSVVRGAGSKGEFFGGKVDLIATKQTRQNEFTAYLTIVGVQCRVRRLL
jgi:hypothetical protein